MAPRRGWSSWKSPGLRLVPARSTLDSAVLPSGSKRDRKQAPLANVKSLGKPEREEKEEEEEEVSSPVVRVLPICVFENFLE